jgi:hypothetical protein
MRGCGLFEGLWVSGREREKEGGMQGEVRKKSSSSPAHVHPREEEDPQCCSKQHHFDPFSLMNNA